MHSCCCLSGDSAGRLWDRTGPRNLRRWRRCCRLTPTLTITVRVGVLCRVLAMEFVVYLVWLFSFTGFVWAIQVAGPPASQSVRLLRPATAPHLVTRTQPPGGTALQPT